jgi:hypothetical protein
MLRHFTIRGADGTDFEGGVYHGRILVSPSIENILLLVLILYSLFLHEQN